MHISTSMPQTHNPMLSVHLWKFCFCALPWAAYWGWGIKQSQGKSLSLLQFSSISHETMTRSHRIYNTIPSFFLHAMFEKLKKKKKNHQPCILYMACTKYTWIQGYWIREGCSNISPRYIICIQGFWNDIVIWWCTSLLYCLAGQISLRFLCRTNTIFPCQRCIISWRS